MPHAEVLRTLMAEMERVGVDADHMVAGLSARAGEAIRALRALPDNAGPAAFLARLRSEGITTHRTESSAHAVAEPSPEVADRAAQFGRTA